jgi:type IV fimbrial biogenesis protein FimT
MKTQSGLSLVELMVTISIATILLAIAVPNFQRFMESGRISSATSNLMGALNFARSESIRRGVPVSLRNSLGGANWGGGWTMFVDNDGDGVQDAGDDTLRIGAALAGGLSQRSTASYTNAIIYRPNGRSTQNGHFAICQDDALANARTVIVNATGRIRAGLDADNNQIPELDDATNLTTCTP